MEKSKKCKALPHLRRPKSRGTIKLHSNLEKDDAANKIFKESINFYPLQNSEKNKQAVLFESNNRLGSSNSSTGNTNNKEWINVKTLSNIRDKNSAASSAVQQIYERVLSNEENFVKGIGEFLEEQDLLRLRKKEILYRKWQERVYIPLRKEIEKVMEEKYSLFDSQRRKEFSNYIRYKNIKKDVFLDAFCPQEYDPFVIHNPHSAFALQAMVPRLDDPLLKFERQKLDEEKVVLRCEMGVVPSKKLLHDRKLPPKPLVPLGRYGNKHLSWLSLSLQNKEGPDRPNGKLRLAGKSNKSEIDFDVWSKLFLDRNAIDREMRIQKKKHFAQPSTMPSEEILTEQFEPIKKNSVRFAATPLSSTA